MLPSSPDQQHTLFQPLTTESTFRRVWDIFSAKWGLFLAINAASILLIYAISTVIFVILMGSLAYNSSSSNAYYYDDGSDMPNVNNYGVWITLVVVELIFFYAVQCLADGATIWAVAELYAGSNTPTFSNSLVQASSHICALLTACLSVAAMLVVPLILGVLIIVFVAADANAYMWLFVFVLVFLVYQIFLTIVTYHMYPAVMIQNYGGIGSIKRSFQMSFSNGNFWHVFCILFLFGAIKLILNALISSLTQMQQGTMNSSSGAQVDVNFGGAGDGILSLALSIVFTTFGSIFQAVIYMDLRVKDEEYTHETLCTEISRDALQYANVDEHSDKEKATSSNETPEGGVLA